MSTAELCPVPSSATPSAGANSVLRNQTVALAIGLALLAGLSAAVWKSTGGNLRFTALALVGALIGLVLYRASYGFAGGFRAFVETRDGTMFRAHVLMLAVMSVIALPLLSLGELAGLRLVGVVTPVGYAFLLGAFIFGIGMQLGGGCASGTLFGLGGGNLRLLATLAGFVGGSTLAASQMDFWWSLPKLEAYTLLQNMSLPSALVVQGASLLAFYGLIRLVSRKTRDERPYGFLPATLRAGWSGPWSLALGAVALGLLNVTVLMLSGQPWGEAPAFALWGSKVVASFGVDVLWWDYWARPGFDRQIEQSVLLDSVSVVNIAIVIGALIAAASAGQFRLKGERDWRRWVAALLGGLVMGYGARLTNGCNIGAYFSGIGTGALSGWVWLALALAGSYVGVKLRPLFGLTAIKPRSEPAC
jgi:uncharacterized membrane protein YedE/YeeE